MDLHAVRLVGFLRRGFVGVVLVLTCIASKPAAAQHAEKCKGNPRVEGECFKFHGRLTLYAADLSLVIWRIGTGREFEVAGNPDSSGPWVPDSIEKRLDLGVQIYGDFEVCPLTKEKPGIRQTVCVESGQHLIVKKAPKD
jgi:hypothetical protein